MASPKIVRMCKKCNQETEHWDNRENKRNPKAPDFKCTICGEAIWPPKKQGIPQPPYQAPMPETLAGKPPLPTPKNGKEKDSSIIAQCLCKILGKAGGYQLEETERLLMLEKIYHDYITFYNRVHDDSKEIPF